MNVYFQILHISLLYVKIAHSLRLQKMRNSQFFVSLVVFVIAPFYASACFDKSGSCIFFQTLCNTTPQLREYCPLTCNVCPQDPCSLTNGGCNQLCSWSDGNVTCSCFPGYRLLDDDKTCVDINECTEGPTPCVGSIAEQYCVNTVGSFSCQSTDCDATSPGTMNYYKSNECCALRNGTCGINTSIRRKLNELNNDQLERIVGGFDVTISAWPWMVQLAEGDQVQLAGSASLVTVNHLCGATLLSNSWIVTTATCVRHVQRENLLIYMGHIRNAIYRFFDTSSIVQRLAEEIILHPELETNNIALVRLSSPVSFDDRVSPICLPCGEVPQPGDKCWIAGFGVTEDNPAANSSRILQEVDVPIVGLDRCITSFQNTNAENLINRSTMMCAGYEEGGRDACAGDSGGPLMCQRADSCEWYLSGISDFGLVCGRQGFYGAYTNVFVHENWIRQTMGNDAESFCPRDYNPCSGMENEMRGCDSMPDACVRSNRARCALTCCLRRTGRESDCYDESRYANACSVLREQCENPQMTSFLSQNCRRTCAFC